MRKRWKPLTRRQLARTLGDNLRSHRRSHGWGPERLASMLELPRGILSSYERGDRIVPTYTLYQLSGALETSIADLFAESPLSGGKEVEALARQLRRLRRLDPGAQRAIAAFLKLLLDYAELWQAR